MNPRNSFAVPSGFALLRVLAMASFPINSSALPTFSLPMNQLETTEIYPNIGPEDTLREFREKVVG